MSDNTLDARLARVRIVAMDVDGIFTDGTIFYDSDGKVQKGFYAHDGLGFELLRRAGILRGFITGRVDGSTDARARYLMLDFYYPGAGDKSRAIAELSATYGIPVEEILWMGDDLNDYTAFETAGITAAPSDATDPIKRIADIVTAAPGGRGAVREVVDRILRAKKIDPVALWKTDKDTPMGKQ